MGDKNFIITALLCLNIIFGLFTYRFFDQSEILELYREESFLQKQLIENKNLTIDSLKNKINTLSTDTITINEWKYYGDTIQYLGKDSVLFIYPIDYYRIIVTSVNSIDNIKVNMQYECYNDTIKTN